MRLSTWVLIGVLGAGAGKWAGVVEASDLKASATALPVRYVAVDGDEHKFEAHHWMKDGYAGGLEEMNVAYAFPEGTSFTAEGHALIDQNDLSTAISLKKESLGFLGLDYAEFRKYYDPTGGVYHPFSRLPSIDTFRNLALNIGHLSIETGLTLPDLPEITFLYEREFKDGTKSRLTWTPVTDGSVTRSIGPSWQEIDEAVDVFSVGARQEIAGFTMHGEQRWEFDRTETLREERNLSTNSTASERKVRFQDQAPQAMLMTTTLGTEKPFWEDKAFASAGYHFAHMDNREFETLVEFDENGNPKNFSNPKRQINARADNDYDTHTWVGNVMISPLQWLTFGTKLKSEVIKRDSNSSYPADAVPSSAGGSTPNNLIDRTDVSLNTNRGTRWGEAVSLRCTAIPRTALYTDLEFEQARVLVREDRQSVDGPDVGNGISTGEIFSRETVTDVRRGTWTLGGQVVPWHFVTLTSHVRHRINNNDYDDQRETDSTGTTARSAFIDGQSIHTNELMTRVTLRPVRWLRPSFRYLFRGDRYGTHVEAQSLVKTGTTSHSYTFDVAVQPQPELSTVLSFTRQTAATWTPARFSSTVPIPTFNADVNTWLMSTEYALSRKVTFTNSLQYSRADNFNDFTAFGLPLGVDNMMLDVLTGINWVLTDSVSVGAEYGFYHFQANSNAETGDYDAHVISFKVSATF